MRGWGRRDLFTGQWAPKDLLLWWGLAPQDGLTHASTLSPTKVRRRNARVHSEGQVARGERMIGSLLLPLRRSSSKTPSHAGASCPFHAKSPARTSAPLPSSPSLVLRKCELSRRLICAATFEGRGCGLLLLLSLHSVQFRCMLQLDSLQLLCDRR